MENSVFQELVSQTPIEALDERILQRFNEAEACEPRMPLRYKPLNIQATLPRFSCFAARKPPAAAKRLQPARPPRFWSRSDFMRFRQAVNL